MLGGQGLIPEETLSFSHPQLLHEEVCIERPVRIERTPPSWQAPVQAPAAAPLQIQLAAIVPGKAGGEGDDPRPWASAHMGEPQEKLLTSDFGLA